MKTFIILLMVIGFTLIANAQDKKYETIVVLDSTGNTFKKTELFSNALEWTVTTFKSVQNLIQMNDKESGKLILKCILSSRMGASHLGATHCIVDIVIKDGKYRITFTDIALIYYNPINSTLTYKAAVDGSKKGMFKKAYTRFVEDLDVEIKELTDSFNKSMIKKSDF